MSAARRDILGENITVKEINPETQWIRTTVTEGLYRHATPLRVTGRSKLWCTTEVAAKWKVSKFGRSH